MEIIISARLSEREKALIKKATPGAKKRLDLERRGLKERTDPSSAFNKRVTRIEKNQPEWTTLDGILILQVPGSELAAIPNSGKKNAASFTIFNVKTRNEIVQLKKKEVRGWLVDRALDEKDGMDMKLFR